MRKLTFKPASQEDEKTIFAWLAEPHMIEFWDNSQDHKDDILNFIHGRKQHYFSGTTQYYIGKVDGEPFAFILADKLEVDIASPIVPQAWMSDFGHTIALDFGIGHKAYLGQGLAAKTLEQFMAYYQMHIDNRADTFFIDPDEDNPRAKHVYEQAGFKVHGQYRPKEGAFVEHTHFVMIKQLPMFVPEISEALAKKLITSQFPEFSDLPVSSVENQGHDNRTYRLGPHMLIRMPTQSAYASKVAIEQEWLPKIAKHLDVAIPNPLKMGNPSSKYPFPFSVYSWLEGESALSVHLKENELQELAVQLAQFLKALQGINKLKGSLEPGLHNWWRGDHVGVYDQGAREQFEALKEVIDSPKALKLWERACSTHWAHPPVWVHGDFHPTNFLIQDKKLCGVIDFGGLAQGDPACDLVIAWTYLSKEAREIFKKKMDLDPNTWMRARGWALWKATFELMHTQDKQGKYAQLHMQIINTLFDEMDAQDN